MSRNAAMPMVVLVVLLVAATGCLQAPDDIGLETGALTAVPAGAFLPDIVEEIPQHLSIQNDHRREWLRFSTTHWNVGFGNLQIRGGDQVAPCTLDGVAYAQCTHAAREVLDASGNVVYAQPAGVAFFHPEHNHWHQSAVATFEVRAGSLDGPVVAGGEKTTFCLIDFDKSDVVQQNSSRVYFECNGDFQGISPGWGDEYHHSTELQELEVTGLPAGVYHLTHLADPLDHWLESDETNNFTWVRFALSRKGANPEVTVLAQAPCQPLDHLGPGYTGVCETGGNK